MTGPLNYFLTRKEAAAMADAGIMEWSTYYAMYARGDFELVDAGGHAPPVLASPVASSAALSSLPQRATGEPEQSDSPLSIPSSCGGVEGHALSVSKVVTTPSGALSPHGQVPLAKAAGVESGPQDSIITIPPSGQRDGTHTPDTANAAPCPRAGAGELS